MSVKVAKSELLQRENGISNINSRLFRTAITAQTSAVSLSTDVPRPCVAP